MLLASCGTDIKFHKWPSGDYHGSFRFPEPGLYKPSISWCTESELLATTVPSNGYPLVVYVGKTTQTHMVIEVQQVQALSFSKTIQNNVLLGTTEGNVSLYDTHQQQIIKQLPSLPSKIMYIEYGAKDSSLAAGCKNGQIYLFNSTHNICSTYCVPNSNTLTAMAYHNKQPNLLAAAGGEGIVAVWDSNTGITKVVDKAHTNSITDLAFSLGDDMVTVGLDHKLNGYDLRTKATTFSCITDSQLTAVGFLPSGEQIAVASSDGKLFCYDKRKIKYPFNIITSHHPKAISRIAFQTLEMDEELSGDEGINLTQNTSKVTTVYNIPNKRTCNSLIERAKSVQKMPSNSSVGRYSTTDFQTPASGDCTSHLPLGCSKGRRFPSVFDINASSRVNMVNEDISGVSGYLNINRQPGCINFLKGTAHSTKTPNQKYPKFVQVGYTTNTMSKWVNIPKSPSQGCIEADNDTLRTPKELVDFTTDTFDRLDDFVNKQFLKVRLSVGKGFIQMENRLKARWEEFNSSMLQFSSYENLEDMENGKIQSETEQNKTEKLEDEDDNYNIEQLKSRIPVLNLSVK